MNKVQEALNEAFEALLPFADCLQYIEIDEDDEEWAKFRLLIKHYRQAAVAYEKCKSALSEIDKREPVGWTNESQLSYLDDGGACLVYPDTTGCPIPIYSSPQQREWVELTEEQAYEIFNKHNDWELLWKEISNALKEVNHG